MAPSLTRTETRTSTSSSRRRRRSSPASMYVPYETSTAKAPRPLMKLDKKSKTRSSKSQSDAASHSPAPALNASLAGPAVPDLPHRPLIASFLSLGRKPASASASIHPIKFTSSPSTFDGSASSREALFSGGREAFDAEFVPSGEISDGESAALSDMDFKGVCEVVKWPSENEPTKAVGRPDQYMQDGSYPPLHDHSSPSRRPPTHPVPYRPDTPFIDVIIPGSRVVGGGERSHGQGMKHSVVRNEPKEGWMGEWNQNDMQDVINQLRSLK